MSWRSSRAWSRPLSRLCQMNEWVKSELPSFSVRQDRKSKRRAIIAHAREKLARFKVPRHVLFAKACEIPLTASGRPQKFTLTKIAQERLGGTMTRPVAIVTGGGRGIGAAIALRLAEDGHDVAVLDLSKEACVESCAAVETHGGRALAIAADVSDEGAVQGAVRQVEESLGQPFVLVNNAGILRDRTITKMSVEDWTAVIDVNLKSVFLTSRACIPLMAESGGGRIVNLSSTAALGTFGEANYSAAKAGVIGLTKTLALEGGQAWDHCQCCCSRVRGHRNDSSGRGSK